MQKLLIAAAVSVAALTGVALAQAPGGGRMAEMLQQADTNHDGNISRAEFDAAHAAHFAQMDANHDGKLDASERPHWGPPPGAPPAGGPPPGGGNRGDANGDGVISRAEYDAQGAHMFERLDADHNGTISAAEIQAARDHMQQHQGQ